MLYTIQQLMEETNKSEAWLRIYMCRAEFNRRFVKSKIYDLSQEDIDKLKSYAKRHTKYPEKELWQIEAENEKYNH